MDKYACDLQPPSFMVGVKMVHPYLHSGTGVLFAHLKKMNAWIKAVRSQAPPHINTLLTELLFRALGVSPISEDYGNSYGVANKEERNANCCA